MIRQISAPELAALIESGPAFELADVRTDEERAIAAIDFTNLCNLQGGIDAWSLLVDPSVPRY